jgi:hypothetical protein
VNADNKIGNAGIQGLNVGNKYEKFEVKPKNEAAHREGCLAKK